MKKLFVIMFVCFLLVLPVTSFGKLEKTNINDQPFGLENLSDSHTVFVEFATVGSSSECSIVSNQLYEIFSSENYDFYYVTLVSDENEVTESRLSELGISEFPGVIFDGGYIQFFDEQSSVETYKDAIVESHSREVAPVELYLEAVWSSSPCYPMVNIHVEVHNDGDTDYHGRLIVSIVEVDSRWKDSSGRPYNYALVDYAVDEDFSVGSAPIGIYTFTDTWFPNIDICGVPADPNVLVIASVFSDDTGFADATVASRLVDGDQPTKPDTPNGPVKVEIGQEYYYTTSSSDPDGEKIKYGFDWDGDYFVDEWTGYYESGEEVTVSHVWEEKGNYGIRVKVRDESRLESFWSDPLPVSFSRNKIFSHIIRTWR